MTDQELLRQLDALLDESPLNLDKIEKIIQSVTRGVVTAALHQRIEDLTVPYNSGLNFLDNELQWRCEEDPTNGPLHTLKGRVEQLLDVINYADDTSLSEGVIETVKNNPVYLRILQTLESSKGHTVPMNEIDLPEPFSPTFRWMREHGLVELEGSNLSFGPKGRQTLQAAVQTSTLE